MAKNPQETNGPEQPANNQQLVRALPATRQELLARKKPRRGLTLVDYVQPLHEYLWENPTYRSLWEARNNAEAITGRLDGDEIKLAEMIQARAIELNDTAVMNEKLWTIVIALRRMATRYDGLHRKDRALPQAAE